jgi:ubiquinone/menaquinone biosynthesis C-methylase UbiE
VSATQSDPGFAIRFLDVGNALRGIQALKPIMLDQLQLRRGLRLLELGCGAGDDARALARRLGPDGCVLGIDAAPPLVAEAERRSRSAVGSLEFRVGDALALDLPDDSFDRCRAERLLMHVEGDPAVAIGEMVRVLEPGGRLAVFELDWESLVIDGATKGLTREIVQSYCDGLRNGCVGRMLPRLFHDAGLVDVHVVPHGVELPYDVFGWLLSSHLDAGIVAGSYAPEQLIGWWDELDGAEERGHFFASLLGFSVAGVKAPQ